MQVTLGNGKVEYYEDAPFTQGGQGTLHLSLDRQSVIKLYYKADGTRVTALRKIINEYNVTQMDQSAKTLFAWPNAIVQAPKLGVRMNNVNFHSDHKPISWWM